MYLLCVVCVFVQLYSTCVSVVWCVCLYNCIQCVYLLSVVNVFVRLYSMCVFVKCSVCLYSSISCVVSVICGLCVCITVFHMYIR